MLIGCHVASPVSVRYKRTLPPDYPVREPQHQETPETPPARLMEELTP
jgi:hypothetical protein